MSIPSIDDILGGEVSSDFEALPEDIYNVVLTTVKLDKGAKSGIPYLKIMATIFDGEYARRVTWGNSSFSDKALPYPGAARNLAQALGVTKDTFPEGTTKDDLPALLAEVAQGALVTVETKLERAQDASGKVKQNADGTPKMRDSIKAYAPPSDEFVAAFEAAVSGEDEDLPF